jgi:hypothetical protein
MCRKNEMPQPLRPVFFLIVENPMNPKLIAIMPMYLSPFHPIPNALMRKKHGSAYRIKNYGETSYLFGLSKYQSPNKKKSEDSRKLPHHRFG